MDRTVLLSAVGFRPAMILPLVDVVRPDEVILVAGKHGEVTKATNDVTDALKDRKVAYKVHRVDDWDVQAWSDVIAGVLDHYEDDDVVVNLTAGHGLSAATLGIHATQRALKVACYDWETYAKTGEHPSDLAKQVHYHSPAALFNLGKTQPVDRSVLALLLSGPRAVGAIAKQLDASQSTVSTSLARLLSLGFLDRLSSGRERIYSLRPGLESLVEKALSVRPAKRAIATTGAARNSQS